MHVDSIVCEWTMAEKKVNRKRNLIAPISIAFFVIGSISVKQFFASNKKEEGKKKRFKHIYCCRRFFVVDIIVLLCMTTNIWSYISSTFCSEHTLSLHLFSFRGTFTNSSFNIFGCSNQKDGQQKRYTRSKRKDEPIRRRYRELLRWNGFCGAKR